MGYDQHGVGMHMIHYPKKDGWTEKDDEALYNSQKNKNKEIIIPKGYILDEEKWTHPEETKRLIKLEYRDPEVVIPAKKEKKLLAVSDWKSVFYYDMEVNNNQTQLALFVGYEPGGLRPHDDFVNLYGYYLLICYESVSSFRCMNLLEEKSPTPEGFEKAKTIAMRYGRSIVEEYVRNSKVDWDNMHREYIRSLDIVEKLEKHIILTLLNKSYMFRRARPIRKYKLV